jgi:FkbM family methyltransferase
MQHSERYSSSGWGTIHFFYGSKSRLPALSETYDKNYLNCKTWFGQARQDEIVARLLRNKRDGYFVDIAANDAIRFSNTIGLERNLNWKGICIEANPKYWMGLAARDCQVVGAVVGNDREEVSFNFKNKALGGIVGNSFDNKNSLGRDIAVTVTLMEVFDRMQAPRVIDYLSLDVEGAEGIVLQSSVLDGYRFRLLTIERPKDSLKQLLQEKGYVMIKQLAKFGETLWMHSSVELELNKTALDLDTMSYVYPEKC